MPLESLFPPEQPYVPQTAPAGPPYPGEQAYPGDGSYPGEQAYPGDGSHPREQGYPPSGEQAYPPGERDPAGPSYSCLPSPYEATGVRHARARRAGLV